MSRKAHSGDKERLIDGLKKGYCFLRQFIVDFVDEENIKQLLVKLILAVS